MDPLRAATSLESPTKLDRARVLDGEGRWLLTVYPEAGEAGGCFESAGRAGGGSWAEDEAEPGRCAVEAARRARGHVRRFCAANRLNRLGTLTYRPPFCTEPSRLRADVARFFRQLRDRSGPLAYLWVPELHADGERFHVHFAVGRYVQRSWIADAWPHGFVHIKLLGDLPAGCGSLGEARAAGRYLGKYVGKAFERARCPGLHRYEVAEGYQPRAIRIAATSLSEALDVAAEIMGSRPAHLWDSDSEEQWEAPHAVWASWDR